MQLSFEKIRLFYFSVRYTRIKQLFARLQLLLKRRMLSHFASASLKQKTALAENAELQRVNDAPLPVFAPRTQFLLSASPLHLKFLNVEREFDEPVEWRPDDLKVGTRLWLLNLHYMEFLEAVEHQRFVELIQHWINNNLPYESGYWLDNWNSYSMSIRVVVWMQQLTRRSEQLEQSYFDQAVSRLIDASLIAQMRFLRSNLELDIGGNHLIKNIKALLWASKYYRGPEALEWQRKATRLLTNELEEQVLNDGMHYELSPAYHCQVFADLLECYQVLDDGLCRTSLARKLAQMAQVVADFTHPDGKISLFNDAGLNMAYSPQQCLDAYEQLFAACVIARPKINYPASGYFGLRCDDELILIDAGALAPDFLPAHGHGDALSFEWSIAGRRIAIDPGVHVYNAGQWRDFSRATRNHNTVTLDDLDQSEFWHAFRVGRRAKIIDRDVKFDSDGLQVEASHTGYRRLAGQPVHRRSFTVAPGRINIIDSIDNGLGQSAVSRIMLHPDCRVSATGTNFACIVLDELQIMVTCDKPLTISDSWCFLDFGEKYPTKQISIAMGQVPCVAKLTLMRQ